jgi:hypothetical protein
MGRTDKSKKNKRPVKPGWQQALEGTLERMREELEKLLPQQPQRIPVPIPIPIPGRRTYR